MTDTNSIKRGRKTLKIAVIVLVVAVVATFAVFTIPQLVGAEDSYVVVSSSMSPAISANDAVIVNEVSPQSVQEGDVIVFAERGESDSDSIDVTTHRVVDITSAEGELAFKTKGDANEEADQGLVPSSALVGRVAFTIPYIGHVVAFAGTQLGFLALVAIPLGLLVLSELYDLARAAQNSRNASDGSTEPDTDAETDGGSILDETATDDEPTGGNDTEDD